MNHLFVWMTLPQGTTLKLGELVFADMQADGTAITAFRYAPEWLSHPGAFPLTPDPQMLPLQAGEFQASNLGFPLRVFDDALPDDWGRRLIVAKHRLPKHQQGPFWIMQAVAGQGLGALTFSGEDVTPERRTAASRHLKELVEAAIAFDAGQADHDHTPQPPSRCRCLAFPPRYPEATLHVGAASGVSEDRR